MEKHLPFGSFKAVYIAIASFGAALMVSPDTLAMLGQFAGTTGRSGSLFILAGMFLFSGMIYLSSREIAGQSGQVSLSWGEPGSMIFMTGVLIKMAAVVVFATGLLVSSGFAFNEIFLYWFPNFGFAFILLGIVCALQFLSFRIKILIQVGLAAIPVIGLLILIVIGWFQAALEPVSGYPLSSLSPGIFGPQSLFIPLLLLLGIELGTAAVPDNFEDRRAVYRVMIGTVVFMGIVFLVTAHVMTLHVPLKKLSQTTIPHIIYARTVLGDTGRYLMGAMIISGSLAAVHGVFTYIYRAMAKIGTVKSVPFGLNQPGLMIIVLSIITGVLMGSGLAGSDRLEWIIRLMLIIWLAFWLTSGPVGFFLPKIFPLSNHKTEGK